LTPVSVAGSATGASFQVRPGQSYALSETGGPPGYAASAWTCTGVATQQGNVITVAAQGETTCRVTNTAIAPRLTLVKTVDNGTTGGAAAPSAWTLTAVNGPSVITGPGGSAQIMDQVAAVGTYTLSESGGPSGYTASTWQCTGGSAATSTTITLALADVATCTITNTAVAPTLTLVKQVHNLNGGTAAASDWTLRAAGPVTIAGATGTDAVTRASIRAGTYTLSEAGGPSDYTASAWSCRGATVSGDMVEVPLGANVVCLIVNTDPQPPIPPSRRTRRYHRTRPTPAGPARG
jgi:large repetitive protein